MKNITIAVDDETHRAARVRAADLGTSVSALVKSYLQELAAGGEPAVAVGVREMPLAYKADLAKTAGPPWLVDGKRVYTRNGKPRQPGSMRHIGPMADGWDEWPAEMLEHFDKLQSEPWSDAPDDPLPFDESQLPQA